MADDTRNVHVQEPWPIKSSTARAIETPSDFHIPSPHSSILECRTVRQLFLWDTPCSTPIKGAKLGAAETLETSMGGAMFVREISSRLRRRFLDLSGCLLS